MVKVDGSVFMLGNVVVVDKLLFRVESIDEFFVVGNKDDIIFKVVNGNSEII